MQCKTCGIEQDEHLFPRRKVAGREYPRRQCRACYAAYHREVYHRDGGKQAARNKRFKQKQTAFVDALKGKPCADCGGVFPPYVMDFDHLDATTKLFSVSNMRYRGGRKRLLEEIAKCDLVCANCHRVRTYLRLNAQIA